MEYLIDTNVALWCLAAPDRLSKKARKLLETPSSLIHFSSISIVEFDLKRERLLSAYAHLADEFAPQLTALGFSALAFVAADASGLAAIRPNRDPFDRMLATQAIRRNLTLVTADQDLLDYRPLRTLW
ncbi:type II toxin-antitoxin system VapC family toxin [Sinimarinibacterium thermocellulolyticum]|uniref:Type II toxin-antitoxin system VapC family toxin n=1 Tax=Sinimarinibacterium thermocellulolyticum TaxID=3170016 RepID=A0ABV2A6D2_9GAMM